MTLVAIHGALSDIGLHRKTNEDSFVEEPPLFAVCDGMGGAQAGEVASGLAAETLVAGLAAGRPLLAAAEAANAAVFARANDNIEQTGMGTTLTAFVLEGETGRFAHIGDSRAYLLRDGELSQLTDDHSLVGEMVRDGRLTLEEAAVHPHRSVLSRALGTEPAARIDEFVVDLRVGDVLLLCSDGLSGTVSPASLQKTLGRRDPHDVARRLIAEARKHGGPDNITAVVVRLEEPAAASEEQTLAVPAEEAVTAVAGEAVTAIVPPDPADDTLDALERLAEDAAGAADAGAAAAPEAADASKTRRRLGFIAFLLAVLVTAAFAAAVTLSSVFYVGVDDGRLAVYSGLPVKIGPVGLHAVYRRSARQYAALAPLQRRVVDAQDLHGKGAAMSLAHLLGMWP